jgi:hypothetical protein
MAIYFFAVGVEVGFDIGRDKLGEVGDPPGD